MSEVIFLVAGAVLGVILDRIWNVIASRPKFVINGGGGGGSQTGLYGWISVTNPYGFMGLRLRGSVLFGRRVHPDLIKGLAVERRTARDVMGVLVDPKTGHDLAMLNWRDADGQVRSRIDLPSGSTQMLCMFASFDDRPDRYFVYTPDESGAPSRWTGIKEFIPGDRKLRLDFRWADGQQRKSFDLVIIQNHDGRHEWRVGGHSGVV